VFSNCLETWILFLQDSSHLFTNHPLCLTFFYDIVVTHLEAWKLLSVVVGMWFFSEFICLLVLRPHVTAIQFMALETSFIECIKEKTSTSSSYHNFFASLNNNTPPFLTPKLNLLSSNNNLHAKPEFFWFCQDHLPSLLLPWFRVFQIPRRITRLYLKNWHFSKAIETLNPIFSNKIENHNSQSSELQHAYMRSQQLLNKTRLVYWTLLKKLAFSNYCVINPCESSWKWVLLHTINLFNSIFFFWEKLWCKASNLCNKNIAWCMCKSYLIFSSLTTSLFSSTHLHGYEKAN
jgi:hypothetical protein